MKWVTLFQYRAPTIYYHHVALAVFLLRLKLKVLSKPRSAGIILIWLHNGVVWANPVALDPLNSGVIIRNHGPTRRTPPPPSSGLEGNDQS